MFDLSTRAASASGVAECRQVPTGDGSIQVSVDKVTAGTGNVTITVQLGSSQEYSSIVGGTISLAAPIGLVIDGKFNAVKATGAGSDVYELEVRS
jgi:hypothetical protein|tara:strand:- start:345 stop:629 length:285 start_codon:yes stop_codon:yes gene_type:complete